MIENLLSTLRKNSWLAGAMFCMAMIYSCEEDVVESRPQLSGDEIVFSVATDSTWQQASRSAKAPSVDKKNTQFLALVGGDSIYIQMVEEENNNPIFTEHTDSTESRGASLLSNTLNKFYLTAFMDANTLSEYMMNQEVELKNGNWTYAPIKYWPHDQNQKIHFFGYAQSIGNKDTDDNYINPVFSVSDDGFQGSFSYTLSGQTADKKDAESQSDLIFAITPDQNKQSGEVNLNFKHALSAIVFNIKNVPSGVVVDSISLRGVVSSGNCEVSGSNDNVSFTWTSGTDVKDYVQVFNATLNKGVNNVLNTTSDNTCFMMIPHTFTDKATIEIYISRTIDDITYEKIHLVKKLKELSQTWEPDKKYTYILSLPDEVKVHVDDKVDETKKIKSNLKIRNTGLSPIYVRAAIIGNWVTERMENNVKYYDVVADWQSSNGYFDWGTPDSEPRTDGNVRNWRKGSDGFYYYMNKLAPGETIAESDNLFKSYTLTDNAPVLNAVLDLTIAVQAVQYDHLIQPIDKVDGKDVYIWPNEIIENIKNR